MNPVTPVVESKWFVSMLYLLQVMDRAHVRGLSQLNRASHGWCAPVAGNRAGEGADAASCGEVRNGAPHAFTSRGVLVAPRVPPTLYRETGRRSKWGLRDGRRL
jgi:hypothetical protein